MQGVKKTQTQIKLGGAPRKTVESSAASPTPSRRPGGGDTFELNIFKKSKTSSPVTIVDDMTYRRSARIIATVDIVRNLTYF